MKNAIKQTIEGKKNFIWDVENFHLLGLWLFNKGIYGHALLCLLGPAFGIKIGDLLKLKWGDLVDWRGHPYGILCFENNKIKERTINYFLSRHIANAYDILKKGKLNSDEDFVFVYPTSGIVLSTSNLNKEFKRYYEQYRNELEEKYYIVADFRDIKTNAFEIAWARSIVKQYQFSKKSFIDVSKYLGHPTVQYTIKLLEVIPSGETKLDVCYYNPEDSLDKSILEIFEGKSNQSGIFYRNGLVKMDHEIEDDDSDREENALEDEI